MQKCILVLTIVGLASAAFARAASPPSTVDIHIEKGEFCWSYNGSAWVAFQGRFNPYQIVSVTATEFRRISESAGEIGGRIDGVETFHPAITVSAWYGNEWKKLDPHETSNAWEVPEIGPQQTVKLWIELANDQNSYQFQFHSITPDHLTAQVCTINTPGP